MLSEDETLPGYLPQFLLTEQHLPKNNRINLNSYKNSYESTQHNSRNDIRVRKVRQIFKIECPIEAI